jgi:hypothetical protein
MKKQFFIIGVCLTSLVIGMSHWNFNERQEYDESLPLVKNFFQTRLGVSKFQDRDKMISKPNNIFNSAKLMSTINPNGVTQLKGFVQYESWDGTNCNGTKTDIQGFQTDYCLMHSSGNGTYKLQMSDGMCNPSTELK